MSDELIVCVPKSLPVDQLVAAATTAASINPTNRPLVERFASLLPSATAVLDLLLPDHLAVLTQKYWGAKGVRLSVSFMDNPPASVRNRILAHANAWGEFCNVGFAETNGTGQVRIARTPESGHWSYLGTDILHIPANEPTMNLDSFSDRTPESEYTRVVRHEVGHTLGAPHEHMRHNLIALLDVERTIAYFRQTQGWSRQEVIRQVLTPLEESSLLGTPRADGTSIMTYSIPGACTKDGRPIPGGTDFDAADREFAAKIYPPVVVPPPKPPPVKPPDQRVANWLVVLDELQDAALPGEMARYRLERRKAVAR